MSLFTRAFRHGAQGVVDDYRAIAGPWGVELGHVGPLTIFQGTPTPWSRSATPKSWPAACPRHGSSGWADEGHLAPIPHVDEILDALVVS